MYDPDSNDKINGGFRMAEYDDNSNNKNKYNTPKEKENQL